MCLPYFKHNFKIGYQNIQGLHNSSGCKIRDCGEEFFNDIEILSEIWGCTCEKEFSGYQIITESEPIKNLGVKKGRKSGGLLVLCKNEYQKKIKPIKILKKFIWLEVSKEIVKNLDHNLFVICSYIHDISSKYFEPDIFEELFNDINTYCDQNTPLLIKGDLNARTGVEEDIFLDPELDTPCFVETQVETPTIPQRNNCDMFINSHGKKIINLCRTCNLKILNGRSEGDPLGMLTYLNENLGASTIDYSICNIPFFQSVKNFMVLPQNELSDHCKIVTELNHTALNITSEIDDYNWLKLKNKIEWNDQYAKRFNEFLSNCTESINEIKQRLEAGLIESSGILIQQLFSNAATTIFKVKNEKNWKSMKSKKWFNKKNAMI